MFKFNITDRRLNPSGKSLPNRQRFLDRVKQSVRDAANRQMQGRKIDDLSDAEVTISRDGIDEPQFHYDRSKGIWDYILPGNTDYTVGDKISKPTGSGGGGGGKGSPDGGGEDEFRFYISYEEFVNAILEDLSLPDMIKESQKQVVSFTLRRAGYTPVGATCNLALERTMIQSIGRRVALKTSKLNRIAQLEGVLEDETDDENREAIETEITSLIRRANAINFLEKADLRYNNFVRQANPITQALMFFVMDVSGSMGEREKNIAKKFFVLLYLFLRRKYKNIEVVFIRHHHTAEECDQATFFEKTETGGTVVSSAYEEINRVLRDRFDVSQWNIYVAQASDGDNADSDTDMCLMRLGPMLPWFQYFTYLEIGRQPSGSAIDFFYSNSDSTLWKTVDLLKKNFDNIATRRIADESQVIEVFRSLFKQRVQQEA